MSRQIPIRNLRSVAHVLSLECRVQEFLQRASRDLNFANDFVAFRIDLIDKVKIKFVILPEWDKMLADLRSSWPHLFCDGTLRMRVLAMDWIRLACADVRRLESLFHVRAVPWVYGYSNALRIALCHIGS